MDINLKGKVALVTGATGDLGRVMAKTLAECGADVIIHYNRNADKAAELTETIHQMGRRALAVQADITSQPSITTMRILLQQENLMPDIVVANAVSSYTWTTILEQSADDFISQFQSTVMQNVYLSKSFIPHLISQNSGRYIAINTECAQLANPGSAAYVAGKKEIRDWLLNRGRPILFSTAMMPAAAAAIIEAFDMLDESDVHTSTLWNNARHFKGLLKDAGFDIGQSETPITPVIVGDEKLTIMFSKTLLERGVFVSAIVFPTVAKGTGRIRCMVSALHTFGQLEKAARIITETGKELGII
ncbi:MAG: SDR family NAD(P)-dependent oxidoreductase [Clostridia bacterium]|nr:SDR family NAD(P)-dependent oxidoreductase [Clostridia bacterium]